jgi:hypothetical protein
MTVTIFSENFIFEGVHPIALNYYSFSNMPAITTEIFSYQNGYTTGVKTRNPIIMRSATIHMFRRQQYLRADNM